MENSMIWIGLALLVMIGACIPQFLANRRKRHTHEEEE